MGFPVAPVGPTGPAGADGAAGAPGAPGPAPAGAVGDFVKLTASGVAGTYTVAQAATALGVPSNPRTASAWSAWTLSQGLDGSTVAVVGTDLVFSIANGTNQAWLHPTAPAPYARITVPVAHRDQWALVLHLTNGPTADANTMFYVILHGATPVYQDPTSAAMRYIMGSGGEFMVKSMSDGWFLGLGREATIPLWVRLAYDDGLLSVSIAPEDGTDPTLRPEHWLPVGRYDTCLTATNFVADTIEVDVAALNYNAGNAWTLTVAPPEFVNLGDGR